MASSLSGMNWRATPCVTFPSGPGKATDRTTQAMIWSETMRSALER